eukprot:1285114-Amorphochlora_amoeboformis.AAC.1
MRDRMTTGHVKCGFDCFGGEEVLGRSVDDYLASSFGAKVSDSSVDSVPGSTGGSQSRLLVPGGDENTVTILKKFSCHGAPLDIHTTTVSTPSYQIAHVSLAHTSRTQNTRVVRGSGMHNGTVRSQKT